MAEPVSLLSPEARQTLEVTADQGWVLTRVDEGSAIEKAGLEVGDVLTAFGGKALPAIVQRRIQEEGLPYGCAPLKLVGGFVAALGLLLVGARRSRLRRLRLSEAQLIRQVDSAMVGRK